jgi:hypothetical protein
VLISPGGLADEIGASTYSNLKLDLGVDSVEYRGYLRIATFVVTLENVGKGPILAGSSG